MEKVKVTSTVNSKVGVVVPELRFSRQWLKKGSVVSIDKETLEELMYDSGFKYMIDTGMLYIDDMKVKQELGIEPEDVLTPVNVIVLSDKDMRALMVTAPLEKFKDTVSKLHYEQIQSLVDFAIENRLGDIDKTAFIKKLCGKDIIKAIQLNDADKEE